MAAEQIKRPLICLLQLTDMWVGLLDTRRPACRPHTKRRRLSGNGTLGRSTIYSHERQTGREKAVSSQPPANPGSWRPRPYTL